MSRFLPPRAPLVPTLVLGLLLAGISAARACDPSIIDNVLEQADAHLSLALRADDLEGARLHLRRAAHALDEAEAQFISCNCQNAPYEAATAAAEARRAATAQDFTDLAVSADAAVSGFQLTLLAMREDLCR